MDQIRVGIVGCGNISGIYFENLLRFRRTTVVACADIDPARAKEVGAKHGVRASASVEDLLNDSEVDVVLNLTVPAAHHSVSLAALKAGKSIYNEKPLAVERAQGKELLDVAAGSGLHVGGAPDTFLGAGLQTCRKVIDDGLIGRPVAASAFMLGRGPENWHPAPEFFYKRGGGPLFDMGPYYLTALVALIGPIKSVTGLARASFAERPITRGDRAGTSIAVETPTHIIGGLEFASGATGQITTSFDVWGANVPFIEIYGSEGTLSVPDPNNFSGMVKVKRPDSPEWEEIPLTHRFAKNSRGIGVLDMGIAKAEGRAARASGDLAFHVLDAMHSILEASDKRGYVDLSTSPAQPAPLAADGPEDDL